MFQCVLVCLCWFWCVYVYVYVYVCMCMCAFIPVLTFLHILSCPSVCRAASRIYEGLGVGVRVGKDGKGLFIENEIYRNTHAGVAVEEGGAPRFEGNAIYEGESDGVVCTAYGCGMFFKNKIHKNSLMGVVITREANPTLIGNVVTKNKRCGVQIADRGRGLLEGNRISGNIEAGVRIESKANPLIQKENRIHDGVAEGVLFTDNGGGIMRGNRVFGNTAAGVAIEESAPLVRKNFVYGGMSHGMHIRGGATPRVERNDIFGNRCVKSKLEFAHCRSFHCHLLAGAHPSEPSYPHLRLHVRCRGPSFVGFGNRTTGCTQKQWKQSTLKNQSSKPGGFSTHL